MKKVAFAVFMLFVVAALLVPVSPLLAAGKSHDVKGEVLSVDVENQKITFKDEKGATQSAPVRDKALETLKTLKAGDKVILTCMDNEKGEHQAITSIKVVPAGGE